jgi:hypothetical protein
MQRRTAAIIISTGMNQIIIFLPSSPKSISISKEAIQEKG